MLFTAETAAEMAKRAHVTRERNRIEAKIAAEMPHIPAVEPHEASFYAKQRLACVRAQLKRVDEMMMTETDPSRIDRLASAQTRLSEQERILDGRPLPGSRKPAADKPARQRPAMVEPS